MSWDVVSYAMRFPMAPLGGLFVGAMGVFIVLGAAVSRLRTVLLWIGFGVAIVAMVTGGRLEIGLPAPTILQVGSLVLAIALEIIAFVILMPRLRPRGDRAVLVGTLAIVGAHFVVMLPAFGPLIAVLGMLCAANAAIAWRASAYPSGAAWFIDGVLKLAFGGAMLLTSSQFPDLIGR